MTFPKGTIQFKREVPWDQKFRSLKDFLAPPALPHDTLQDFVTTEANATAYDPTRENDYNGYE